MKQKTFFTSDWHIGNANVIQFSNRPFRNIDHMHEVLINNHNSTVPVDGITYCLGDMLQGSIELCTNILSAMNGTKILIAGNHDPSASRALRCGFALVLNSAGIVIGGEHVTMSHCPLRGVVREDITGMRGAVLGDNWHGESKHWKFSIGDWGQYHLHGHIHSPNGGRSTKTLGRQYDVGVDANNYTPVSVSTLERWITSTKKETKTDED